LQPTNQASLEQYRRVMLPAWKHTLQVEWPQDGFSNEADLGTPAHTGSEEITIKRSGEQNGIKASLIRPGKNAGRKSPSLIVVLANPDGRSGYFDTTGAPTGLAGKLVERGFHVLLMEKPSTEKARDPFLNFYTTYNRTELQNRVGDIVAVCSHVRASHQYSRVVLCGTGRTGLAALLAAPAADAVSADCDALDLASDQALLARDLFCPGIRNIGAFEGSAILAAPHPLLLHNTAKALPTAGLSSTYLGLGARRKLTIESERLSDEQIVSWISRIARLK
jgi:hypothetical protein